MNLNLVGKRVLVTGASTGIGAAIADPEIPNWLPIMKGWNYTVRLFRPGLEIFNDTWRFPEAQPVS